MRTPLSAAELDAALADLPGWSYSEGALTRSLRFANFREALTFLVRAGFEAEAIEHHPEIHNVYNRVTFVLRTHDAGNVVTQLDVELARRISAISPTGT